MRIASEEILTHLIGAAPAVMLRAGCVVSLLVAVSGCGGGADGSSPAPSMPTAAPEQLVVGTAVSIDSGASGNPVSVRVARSANGDGFAVWLAHDGTRRNLWANRQG